MPVTPASPGREVLLRRSKKAVSCDVERGFNCSGMMVSKRRHALSSDSIRAGIVISAWSQVPNLLPETQIIKVFNDKSSRATDHSTAETINVDN